MRTSPQKSARYNLLHITLHWVTVLLIVAIAIIGLSMTDMPLSAEKLRTYALHKSLGLTVLGLTIFRLLWRWLAGVPAELALPRWQQLAARTGHAGLYLLLLALPLSGWLYNSASNFPLQWFGLFNVPALAEGDKALKAIAHEVHETLFWVLLALVLIHAVAALWHHYRLRDDTLRRMLPSTLLPSRSPTIGEDKADRLDRETPP